MNYKALYIKERNINEILADSLRKHNREKDKLIKENKELKSLTEDTLCVRGGCKWRLHKKD